MRRLRLGLLGPGERVVLRIGLAAGERLAHQHVDGDAVLGVHHHQRARFRGVLHGPQDLAVVGVEHPGVRHEHLEAGDALVVDEVGHRLQRGLVHLTDDLVERVVDVALARGFLVAGSERLVHVEADGLRCEVDDRGDPAPRRSARAGVEVVGGDRAAERQRHVDMGVDATGDDVLAGGVDDGVADDAQGAGLTRREDRRDRLAVDQHVGLAATDRGDDRAAGDQCECHECPSLLFLLSWSVLVCSPVSLSSRRARRMRRGDGRDRTPSRPELP